MTAKKDALNISYLVLFPFTDSAKSLKQFSLRSPKGASYFFEHHIDVRSVEGKTVTINGISVEITIQIFDEQVWVYECTYTIDPSGPHAIADNNKLQTDLKRYLLESVRAPERSMLEEYTILKIVETKIKPDDYVKKNAKVFAGFIRAFYDKTMDQREVRDILVTRVRYSEYDMVIVDWNGAVIMTDDGIFESDIGLLKIGNYQLIRYRMLDAALERRLNYLRDLQYNSLFGWSKGNKILKEIVEQRLSLLLTFEKLDTSLLLIGDWYSSQLYRAIVEEFYINRWKEIVQSKLDNLKSLHETISENFTLSWRRVIDQITFVGWFVMMIGYFIIFYLDIGKK